LIPEQELIVLFSEEGLRTYQHPCKEEYEPCVGPEFRRFGAGYPVLVLGFGSMITLRGIWKDKRSTDRYKHACKMCGQSITSIFSRGFGYCSHTWLRLRKEI